MHHLESSGPVPKSGRALLCDLHILAQVTNFVPFQNATSSRNMPPSEIPHLLDCLFILKVRPHRPNRGYNR